MTSLGPVNAPVLSIDAESARTADAARLIAALSAELAARYEDDGGEAYFTPADVETPGGVFLVARQGGVAVGCGAVRPHEPGVGEVKRMYVAPEARGRGVGRALLRGLEAWAAEWGYARLILETGTAQPEAVALYESAGWIPIPKYGPYADDPRSLCYQKIFRGAP